MRLFGLGGNRRLVIGGRVLVPTGPAVHIGPNGATGKGHRGLGKVEEYGVARSITLVIGQRKGKAAKNRQARCARQPGKFSVARVDEAFAKARGLQVAPEHVDATRVAARGWYHGDDEPSATYQVAYVPPAGGGPPDEPTFAAFRRNMNRLAERLAEEFCQDSVLILRDDGKTKTVAGATWQPRKRKK